MAAPKPLPVDARTAKPPRYRSEALLCLLTLLTVFGATWLVYNARLPIQVSAGDEIRQVFFRFHPIERTPEATFRWTTGDSQVCFDQLGGISRSAVELRLIGGYALPLGLDSVTVLVNDRPIVTLPLVPEPRRYSVLIDDVLERADDDCLGLSSQVRPAPDQSRLLGVPLASLSLRPLADGGFVRPALIQLLLNLTLALSALWLGRRCGLPLIAPTVGVIGVALLLTVALLGRWVAPGLGLVRTLLPLTAGLLLIGAGTLVYAQIQQRLRGRRWLLLLSDLGGLIFWAAWLYGVTRVFQLLLGVSGMWPLKAGVQMMPDAAPVVPIALFAAWVALYTWLLGDPAPTAARPPWFGAAALIGVGGVLLPVALKISVRGWVSLFTTFTNNPYEYISDVGRVGDAPLAFLRSYVDLAPSMALHSSTHPPGAILLLWVVERTLGAGPLPASFVAIGLSSGLGLAALWLGWLIGGVRLGLLAGALTVLMPGHQMYSVTSMDGLFNSLIALGAVAFLRSIDPGASWRHALLAGMIIAAALFFSYAATQLAFFGMGVVLASLLRRRPPAIGWHGVFAPVVRQAAIAAGAIGACYLLIFLLTGFHVLDGALGATAHNAAVMRGVAVGEVALRAFVPPDLSFYVMHLLANLLPFAWYLGPWGLQAAMGAGLRAWAGSSSGRLALLAAGLAALIGGMLFSGLFNREVERIWGFTYPLLAVLIGAHILQGDTSYERRWRVAMYLGLFAAQSIFIRTVLNTFW